MTIPPAPLRQSPVYRRRVQMGRSDRLPAPAPPPRGPGRRGGHGVLVFLALVVVLAWIATGLALGGRGLLSGLGPQSVPGLTCDATPDAATLPPPAQGAASAPPAPGTRLVLGDPQGSGLPDWPGLFDSAPTLYDFDGDGTQEVVAHSNDTHVYVFDPTTGRALARLPTSYPLGWHFGRVLNDVAGGVLVPGEPASIVVADAAACVAAWQFVPGSSTTSGFTFQKSWERRLDECHPKASMDAGAALADLDADGILEVLVQAEEQGLFALRGGDGSTLWKQCWAGGNAAPTTADLDGDGTVEAIFASDSGFVSVLQGRNGQPLWTFDARAHGIAPGSIPVTPTVAELDGRTPKEILFAARNAPQADPALFGAHHLGIFAVHRNHTTWQAELAWLRQPDWGHPMSDTRLVVRDVDGNGSADVFGMDWNTIGHRPGDWQRLGPAHVFRLDANGNDVWVRSLDTAWSNQDILVADLDGDAQAEVAAPGPAETTDGIWILSADTGEPEAFLPLGGWRVLRGPVLAPLHPDGLARLVIPVQAADGSERGGLVVHELNVPYDPR